MKIVVLDGYTLNPGDNPWDALARLGDLTVYDRTPAALTLERANEAEILLTNKTPLPAEILSQLQNLRFVAVLATGYNIVDVATARQRGVPVANVPEYGTQAVAQHVLALLLELCQRVALHERAVKAGEWASCPDFCFWKEPPIELAGLTLGIVGYGRIGRRVAELARAFGMTVIRAENRAGNSRQRQVDEATPELFPVPELLRMAEVVSLHCPLTAENIGFVDRELLRRMKPSSFLINTARGGLVDEAALAEALNSGWIAGAALDVVSQEPIRADNPLLAARNCILTPHMAWGSLAARRRLMATTVANLEAFLAGRPINLVN